MFLFLLYTSRKRISMTFMFTFVRISTIAYYIYLFNSNLFLGQFYNYANICICNYQSKFLKMKLITAFAIMHAI